MRKLLALAASLVCFGAFTVPASASGAFTQTVHVHSMTSVLGPPPGGVAAGCPSSLMIGAVVVSPEGNGVMHGTINSTGDWFTTTYEGQATIYVLAGVIPGRPPKPILGPVIAQGHLATWFGAEDNNQNGVLHFTLDFNGITPPGDRFGLHGNLDVTVNANGDITANPINIFCRT